MCANHEAVELARKSKGKQAKRKVCSKTSFFFSEMPLEGPAHIEGESSHFK